MTGGLPGTCGATALEENRDVQCRARMGRRGLFSTVRSVDLTAVDSLRRGRMRRLRFFRLLYIVELYSRDLIDC